MKKINTDINTSTAKAVKTATTSTKAAKPPKPQKIRKFSTNNSVSLNTLYRAYQDGMLFMRPLASNGGHSFQRLPHKSRGWKIYLIHSIFAGTPLPSIFVYMRRGVYHVTDGQQRLSALFEYLEDKLKLTAKGMAEREVEELLPHLDGTKFSDLHEETQENFLDYELQVEHLGSTDEQKIMLVYNRLNSGTKNMSPAELKASTFRGPIIEAAFAAQAQMGFKYPDPKDLTIGTSHLKDYSLLKMGVVSKTDIMRMGDLEYILELMLATHKGAAQHKKEGLTDFCSNLEGLDVDDVAGLLHAFNENMQIIEWLFQSYLLDEYGEENCPDVYGYIRGTEFKKKHDFYSLFVAVDSLRKSEDLDHNYDMSLEGRNLVYMGMLVNSDFNDLNGVKEIRLPYLAVTRKVGPRMKKKVRSYVMSRKFNWNYRDSRVARVSFIKEVLLKTGPLVK